MGTEMKSVNSVYAKIHNIMTKDLYVQKTGFNSHHKYNYVTERDILEAVRVKMQEEKLIYHFSVLQSEQISESVIRITYEFSLIDVETGDQFTTTVVADGQDKGDKAPYKAFTGAQKYFFMKLFMIATGDDPESTGDAPVEREVVAAKPAFNKPVSLGAAPKLGSAPKLTATDLEPAPAVEKVAAPKATLGGARFNKVKKEEATDPVLAKVEASDAGLSEDDDLEKVVNGAEAPKLKTSRRFEPGQRFKQNKAE